VLEVELGLLNSSSYHYLGIITVNEARSGLGFEDLEGEENNQIRIPQNITGSAVNPGIGGRPEDSGASEE